MKIVCMRINITKTRNANNGCRHSSYTIELKNKNITGTSPQELPGQLLDYGGEGWIPNAGASASHATTSNQNTSTQNSNSNSNSNPRAELRPSWMTSLPSGN